MKKLFILIVLLLSASAAAQTLVPCRNGGTGLTSYTIGDILYASAACTIAKLADVAVGSVLVSGGTGVVPAWSTSVPGTLTTAAQANITSVGTLSSLGVSGTGTILGVTRSGSATSTFTNGQFNAIGPSNTFAVVIENVATAGTSYGLKVSAGGNASDIAMLISDRENTPLFGITGAGSVTINSLTAASGTPNSICQNSATKEITVNAALTCTVSSRDYKTGIKPFSLDGLRMVSAMEPDTFFYRDRLDRERIGLMAEDLAAIDPRLAEWSEGKANSIDFPAMFGVMVKAIKELSDEVEALRGIRYAGRQ